MLEFSYCVVSLCKREGVRVIVLIINSMYKSGCVLKRFLHFSKKVAGHLLLTLSVFMGPETVCKELISNRKKRAET